MSKICVSCKKDSGEKRRCKSCQEKQNKKARQKYKERLENGLCANCGEKRDSKRTLCLVCRDKQSSQEKVRSDGRFIEGRCNVFDCKNQRLIKNRFCENHRFKKLTEQHKRGLKLAENGLCTLCGKEPFLECFKDKTVKNKLCLEHFLKQRANTRFGNTDLWIGLLDKLKEQNYKCFYTGETLLLGFNDSLDHVFPVAHFPEMENDITNIRWVSRKVNKMKNDNTHEEFMKLIEQIYKYRKEMERKGKVLPSSP